MALDSILINSNRIYCALIDFFLLVFLLTLQQELISVTKNISIFDSNEFTDVNIAFNSVILKSRCCNYSSVAYIKI